MQEDETAAGSWNAPATPAVLAQLAQDLGHALPDLYRSMLARHDGGSGFVGDDYLTLWPAQAVKHLNAEYEVEANAPGLLVIGSNGGGEAYAFDLRGDRPLLVTVPFVGVQLEHTEPAPHLAAAFLAASLTKGAEAEADLELVELTPVIFGGDAMDPENKAWLERADHIDYVRHWNAIIRDLHAQEG